MKEKNGYFHHRKDSRVYDEADRKEKSCLCKYHIAWW